MLGVGGSSLKKNKFEPTANMLQQVVKHVQHLTPNNVAICYVEMLQLFSQSEGYTICVVKGCNKNVPYLLWYIHKQGSLAILSPMKQQKIN